MASEAISTVLSTTGAYFVGKRIVENAFRNTLKVFKDMLDKEVWYETAPSRWTRDKDLYVTQTRPPADATVVKGRLIPFKTRLKAEFDKNLPKINAEIFELLFKIYEAASPSQINIDPNASTLGAAQYLLGENSQLANVRVDADLREAIKQQIMAIAGVNSFTNFTKAVSDLNLNAVKRTLEDLKTSDAKFLSSSQKTDFLRSVFTNVPVAQNIQNYVDYYVSEINKLKSQISSLHTGDYLVKVRAIREFGNTYSLNLTKNLPLVKSELDTYLPLNYKTMVEEIFGVLLHLKPKRISINVSPTNDTMYCLNQMLHVIHFVKLHKFT